MRVLSSQCTLYLNAIWIKTNVVLVQQITKIKISEAARLLSKPAPLLSARRRGDDEHFTLSAPRTPSSRHTAIGPRGARTLGSAAGRTQSARREYSARTRTFWGRRSGSTWRRGAAPRTPRIRRRRRTCAPAHSRPTDSSATSERLHSHRIGSGLAFKRLLTKTRGLFWAL